MLELLCTRARLSLVAASSLFTTRPQAVGARPSLHSWLDELDARGTADSGKEGVGLLTYRRTYRRARARPTEALHGAFRLGPRFAVHGSLQRTSAAANTDACAAQQRLAQSWPGCEASPHVLVDQSHQLLSDL